MLARFLAGFIVLVAMFFLPAGTLAYWEAWLYLGLLFSLVTLVLLYFLKNDPGFLERRMRLKEKEAQQRWIVGLSYLPFLLAFLLPGLDRRFGWSNPPVALTITADVLVFLGYGLVFLVFYENRFASRIVEVEKGQTVISTGPYALVRHPMYLGTLVLLIFSPLALGSYWAMLPALLLIPVFVARILNEESVLSRQLDGYQEYTHKVRYRLFPGIW
jgi:protein-S-isoprenylcysteine O-methyltransferase Ste14